MPCSTITPTTLSPSAEKKATFAALHRLILRGELLVWDPNTKILRGSEDIAGISMNGDAIQISLVADPLKLRRKPRTG